tara:strand:+ start:39127 stop:39738 length:612 start_codon:yes stop_codon:yes gene_type:complete
MKFNRLVLIRHGQSEWNKMNLFTGWKDPGLTQQGIKEAKQAGKALKKLGLKFDYLFTSALLRAQMTGSIILETMGHKSIETITDYRLNERDYGDLSGLNKDDARKKWGKEQVHIWRRSFDISPPGGESLQDTSKRVLPYFEDEIIPLLNEGKNILLAAHGNSLRALIMKLDGINSEEIVNIEIQTGEPIHYQVEDNKISRLNF